MHWYIETLNYRTFLLSGLFWTVLVSIAAIALGSIVGLLALAGRECRLPIVRSVATIYVDVFRATPMLAQLLWIYYALPILTGYSMSGVTAGILGLSLHGGSYLCEVFRSSLASVHSGQFEACDALGISRPAAFARIILPQAARNVLPAYCNAAIAIVKDSSILSFVSVSDLLRNGQVIAGFMQREIEPLTTVAVIYLVITAPLALASFCLEKRLDRNSRNRALS